MNEFEHNLAVGDIVVLLQDFSDVDLQRGQIGAVKRLGVSETVEAVFTRIDGSKRALYIHEGYLVKVIVPFSALETYADYKFTVKLNFDMR